MSILPKWFFTFMAYEYYWKDLAFYATFSGHVDARQIRACDDIADGSSVSEQLLVQVWDFMGIDKLEINSEDIKEIAAMDYGASFSIKKLEIILIMKNEDVPLAEFYRSQCTDMDWKIHIFNDRHQAELKKNQILKVNE